jgi:hypothetical protein
MVKTLNESAYDKLTVSKKEVCEGLSQAIFYTCKYIFVDEYGA